MFSIEQMTMKLSERVADHFELVLLPAVAGSRSTSTWCVGDWLSAQLTLVSKLGGVVV